MRRQDIQLLARARQGDIDARCEVGRRYLLGADGFPHHVSTGLEYLAHASLADSARAAVIVAEALPLHELIRLQQTPALITAASAGSTVAQLKYGAWVCASQRYPHEARRWLEPAAQAGQAGAGAALQALAQRQLPVRSAVLAALGHSGDIDARAVALLAVALSAQGDDAELMAQTLASLLALAPVTEPGVADAVCTALARAASLPGWVAAEIAPELIERCLDARALQGDAQAAWLLGRALCGIDHAPLLARALTAGQNMRKGAALLLRAADAGVDEAWLLLYRVHADNHASVANPQMARFFLEKAAIRGDVEARRRLGALILRTASRLHESEQGMHWLYEAAAAGDACAAQLLRSLVLPVGGDDDLAMTAIEAIRRDDPWLACRLRTARDFGLTKLEALSVDIVAGVRSWGLVVGPNPFIVQSRLAAARAVPALTAAAGQNLRRSAAFLQQARQDGGGVEGDLRKRGMRLRRALESYRIDEAIFFAEVRSTTLDALRQGTKWAFRARQPLRLALAA